MGARCLLLGFVARLEGDPPMSERYRAAIRNVLLKDEAALVLARTSTTYRWSWRKLRRAPHHTYDPAVLAEALRALKDVPTARETERS